MLKQKEYYICDRCKEELVDKPIDVYDRAYHYELCDECKYIYDKYDEELFELDKKCKEIMKKYKFGMYLPKEDEDE